jgi:ribonuclease-3
VRPAAALAERLGLPVGDSDLITQALVHTSWLHEHPDDAAGHNERLEFLGDAVLSLLIAALLYREFPEASEGDLSRYRASLVSGESLADIAAGLGFSERLRLGVGELRSGGFRRRSTLADAFEAVIGAIYLDGGLEAARGVLEPLYQPRLAGLKAAPLPKDAKTRLQEYLQERALPLPHYTVESITGEPHEQTFTVRCAIDGDARTAEGIGSSRRRAEQMAAEALYDEFERREPSA